jgi:hypothetical protein
MYSHPEVFLRELISNASDAADKLRFSALHDSHLLEDDPDLNIKVAFDKEANTVTISDNGINKGGIKPYAKLADQLSILFLVACHLHQEFTGTGLGNRTEIRGAVGL